MGPEADLLKQERRSKASDDISYGNPNPALFSMDAKYCLCPHTTSKKKWKRKTDQFTTSLPGIVCEPRSLRNSSCCGEALFHALASRNTYTGV